MKKMFVILVGLFSLVVVFSGCYYHKEDIVFPKTSCDTTNITYAATMLNILKTNCYVCHGGNAEGSFGIKLDSYAAIKNEAVSGELMRRITSKDPAVMMPQGGPALSDCDKTKIDLWIKHGFPQ